MNFRRLSPTAAYLITVGLVSILGQVVLLRELSVAYYGIELIYILALAFWLPGTALGAVSGRRSVVPNDRAILNLLLSVAVVLIIDFVFVRAIRNLFGAVPGGFLPFQTQLAALAIAVLPPAFITGVLFRSTSRKLAHEGGSLAKAYALESAGGIIGGLLSTLFLAFRLQNISAMLFCCAFTLLVAAIFSGRARLNAQRNLSIAGLILLMPATFFSRGLDRLTTSWNHPDLHAVSDTPYGRVTITSREDQLNVFENDGLTYETGTTSAEELVVLTAIQRRLPDDVLVLGGGFAGIIEELTGLKVKEIDYVEQNEPLIEMIRRELPAEFASSLADGGVSIFYDDPRRFLQTSRSYDAILAAMPEPMSAQNNRFYTAEFFRQCSASLRRGGVFSFAIRSAENLLTPRLVSRNRTIYAALKSVFPYVIVLPGSEDIFLASDSPLTTDPAALIATFGSLRQETRLVTPRYIRYLYTNDRFDSVNALLARGSSIFNSDFHPVCYNHTISIWLSMFFGGMTLPGASNVDISGLMTNPAFWFTAALTIIMARGRKFAMTRKFMVVAIAGATGMISETLLLLNYQSARGALYQDIGLLLTTFMAGLAAGAICAGRLMKHADSVAGRWSWLGVPLLAGLALLNLMILFGIRWGLFGNLALTSIALGLDGTLVSAVFVFESVDRAGARGPFLTWLYSADLVGGALGSIAAIFFLIPVYGMLSTSALTAAAACWGMLFLK